MLSPAYHAQNYAGIIGANLHPEKHIFPRVPKATYTYGLNFGLQ